MNGAESVVRTLAGADLDVCFANPGTSEMHFVDALDRTGLMRCVLGLFEGVVTGAADGYSRMAGKPAVTLLHLAPGLANASANIHNAKKARSPMVNIVGDHAHRHLVYDAPLTADVAATAAPFSHVVRTAQSAGTIGADTAAVVAAARSHPYQIATLIAPADTGWDAGGVVAPPIAPAAPVPIDDALVREVAGYLDETAVIIAGGTVLESAEALALIEGICEKTRARFVVPLFPRRLERGGGVTPAQRIPYVVDDALELLSKSRTAILLETEAPVGFFAYPGKPSEMLPPDCKALSLAGRDCDGVAAVRALADFVGAKPAPAPPMQTPEMPGDVPLDPDAIGAAIAAGLPENAVVCDEAITAGRSIYGMTANVAPHSWLALTGGAIGIGPPLATGAAIGAPDRPVVNLQADGSAMYTIQALWTQAREGLNVTTVILANKGYAILKSELLNVGANPGRSALDMLEIDRPRLDFVGLARGMGVPGERVDTAAGLARALAAATAEPGPVLIEAVVA
ncbi:MAG: acetolactate synthase large subunit [Pseudomonadota bacterium]